MLITGCELYDQSVATIGIQILLRMENPATTGPVAPWTIETWYQNENPLNKLIASGPGTGPSIVNAPAATLFWPDQIRHRDRLMTTDVGPIEFRLRFATTLAAGGTFTIQVPAAFILKFDSLLWCYFDFTISYDTKVPSEVCTDNGSGLITIKTP